jgi:CDP-diglyceride synthetase
MSGYPLTKDFLAEMNGRWFRKRTRPSRQKNARNTIVAVVVTSIGLISEILLPNNIWVFILVIAGFVAVIAIAVSHTLIIRRRFRRASEDLNPEGTHD